MNDISKVFWIMFAALFCIIIGTVATYKGVTETEIAECKDWQEQALKYPDYYITKWQEGQCKAHNVEIGAPVR